MVNLRTPPGEAPVQRSGAGVAERLADILGADLPVAVRAYDGSRAGPAGAPTLVVGSPNAFRRILTAPGELGVGRALVAGDLDVDGDLYHALELLMSPSAARLGAQQLVALARLAGPSGVRPLAPPVEEARLRGRRHSPGRDAAAIRHHYDVGNDFYRLVLGPTLTYSCGLWASPAVGLDAAQDAKHELVCEKLRLTEGHRLLDVGCGWGSMLLHAARHGVRGVGVTLSAAQVELATRRAAEAGLAGRLEVRLQDYRDVGDGPYDAVSSIGMFEHVGLSRLQEYFERLHALLRPGGRLLNHGISRPPGAPARLSRRGFFDRYVFPDGELHEVGTVVSAMQRAGFEVRHVESLREHYALTLRAWVANLEANWDEAVHLAGAPRTRIWRLFMAGSAVLFEANRTQVHQILAVKPDGGHSGFALRPAY